MAWKFFTKDGAEKRVPATVAVPAVRVTNTATQACANAGWTTLTWDTEVVKTDVGMHSIGSNPSRLVCTVAGQYLVTAWAPFTAGSASGEAVLGIWKNGANTADGEDFTAVRYGGEVSHVLNLNAGDYIELRQYNATGGTVTVSASAYASMTKIDGSVVSYVGVPGSLVGQELAYAQITSGVNVTSATEATGTTVVTAPAFTVDGSTPVLVEFFAPSAFPASGVSSFIYISLFEGATQIGRLGIVLDPAAANEQLPVNLRYRFTPAAGSHTYTVTAHQSGGNGTISAGAGGTGTFVPAFIRVTRAA